MLEGGRHDTPSLRGHNLRGSIEDSRLQLAEQVQRVCLGSSGSCCSLPCCILYVDGLILDDFCYADWPS